MTTKNYSAKSKFLYDGYSFDKQQKWLLRREELRDELKREFEEMFVEDV